MSADIRERLHEAAAEPSSPLDTTAVYRRGRRGRQLRVAVAAAAMVLGVAGAAGVVLSILGSDDLPVVEPVGVQEELLADDWVSWREYRIAVTAVSDCLDERGADPSYAFDEQAGRFTFAAADTAPFDACSSVHLDRVEAAWWDKVGPDADGVTWQQYRTAVQDIVDCVNRNGGDAQAEFSLDGGAYGYTFRQGTEGDCWLDGQRNLVVRRWDEKVAPSASEDRAFYESVARCLRDLGHDVPDADSSTLSEASRSFPADYDSCFNQMQDRWSPGLTDEPQGPPTDVTALPPPTARRLAEALAGTSASEAERALAGWDAVEVQAVEGAEIEEPSSPVWFTLVTCEDGSRIIDQAWVRDADGEVHGVSVSSDC